MNTIWIMTKNNLKLLWRRKVMIIIALVGMIATTAAVANAFHTLLDKADDAQGFKLGYTVVQGSKYELVIDTLMDELEKEDIVTQKYSSADADKLIESGEQDVFVTFDKDSYSIVGSEKKSVETRVIQYSLFNVERNMNAFMSGGLKSVEVKESELPTTKTPDAENYYCHAFICCFLSISPIFLSVIYYEDRKNRIWQRYKTGKAGSVSVYLGKYLASFITTMVVFPLLGTLAFCLLFDMKPCNLLIYGGLLALAGLGFTSFGILFFILFKQPAVSIGSMFMILWFVSYLGGVYETYIYCSIPETIKRLSPLYYLNRSLIELSVNGKSDYAIPCVIIMIAMTVVFSAVGMIATKVKKEV